jgi:HEAT repeat protein
MSFLSAARRGAWNGRWLIASICAVAVISPAVSRGQRAEVQKQPNLSGNASRQGPAPHLTSQVDAQTGRPADPVEAIEQALLLPAIENPEVQAKRKKMIETAIPDLKTIMQLRKAYFLRDWRLVDPEKFDPERDKESDTQRLRKEIGVRLTKTISQAAQGPDSEKKVSVAMWIADLAGNDKSEHRDAAKFARGLTGIVLQLLKEKDTTVRQAALHALGQIMPSPADAFPALKNTLAKDVLGPRRLAAYALTDLVRNAKEHPRFEQLEILEQVISTASSGLRDADEAVRGYSLLAILDVAKAFFAHVATPGEELTIKVKDDAKGKLNEKTVLMPDLQKVMKTFQTAMPQLLQALDDPKVKVRLTALQALDEVCNARAKIVHDLRELQKFTPEKQENTSELLKAYAVPDPLSGIVERDWRYITRLLKDDDERVRRGAIEFLEVLGEQVEPALPEITQALRDPNPFVRWTAARTLRNVPPAKVRHDAVRALAFMLMDSDQDVSKAAALTLEALGKYAEDAVPELGHMIANADPANRAWDPDNRLAAMRALAAIGPERTMVAIPKLIAALADQEERIRRLAAETLGLYGPAARSALPALWQALRDEDGEVRLHAAEAILSIKSEKK